MEVSQPMPAGGRQLRPHSQCWDQRGEARWDSKGHRVSAQSIEGPAKGTEPSHVCVMQRNITHTAGFC